MPYAINNTSTFWTDYYSSQNPETRYQYFYYITPLMSYNVYDDIFIFSPQKLDAFHNSSAASTRYYQIMLTMNKNLHVEAQTMAGIVHGF